MSLLCSEVFTSLRNLHFQQFILLHLHLRRSVRVVTEQYSNGLFGSFDTSEPSKQTLFSQSIKQTNPSVCLTVWQTHMTSSIVDMVMGAVSLGLGLGLKLRPST